MALIKCPECGHMISDKAQKCPKCECPIEHKETVEEEQPQIAESIKEPERPISTLPPEDVGIYDTEGEDNNSKKKKKIIIIAAAAVIVLVALALTVNTGDKGTAVEKDGVVEDSIAEMEGEVEENSMGEGLDFTIRTDGVGSFLLGKPFNDYNTQAVGELYANDTIDIRSSFVVERDDSFEDISYSPYMRLDDHGITMLVLYGGFYVSHPDLSSCTVKGIYVYSPAFTTENGIHVGMTAEEIISKYSATIELQAGEGDENIEAATLDVPGCKGMKFIINLKPLISKHGGTDFLCSWDSENNCDRPNFRENLKKEIRNNCRLGRIIVGEFFDYTQEVSGLSVDNSASAGGRTSQSTREWIQGTWLFHSPSLGTSKLVFNGKTLTTYVDGKVDYSGDYKIGYGRIDYGKGFYIDVDEKNKWLKFSEANSDYYGKLTDNKYVYPNFTGFDSWEAIWRYFDTKRSFSQKNAGKSLKTIAIKDNNFVVEGKNVGQIGYDGKDPGTIRGNQIWFILLTNQGDYRLVGEAEGGKITCLYFEPALCTDPLGLPFLQYFIPQVSNGKFSVAFSVADEIKPNYAKVYRYYADD